MINKIPVKELILQLMIRFFTGGISKSFINTIVPILVSIYSISYDSATVTTEWYFPIIFAVSFIFIYNIISEKLQRKEKQELRYFNLLNKCYIDQSDINRNVAVKIFRLNKLIEKCLNSNKPIQKILFDKIADFDTVAFDICNSIYKIIEDSFGNDTECEVTVYCFNHRKIFMVAYANKNMKVPSSYNKKYRIINTNRNFLFVRLLSGDNSEIFCCANKEEIEREFKFIKGSEIREKKICQYIGIPLKTSRNKNELLLQIDVSKPNVFGETKDEMEKLAKGIFYPYILLLYKAYERDQIFNKYYDMIVEKSNLLNNNSP